MLRNMNAENVTRNGGLTVETAVGRGIAKTVKVRQRVSSIPAPTSIAAIDRQSSDVRSVPQRRTGVPPETVSSRSAISSSGQKGQDVTIRPMRIPPVTAPGCPLANQMAASDGHEPPPPDAPLTITVEAAAQLLRIGRGTAYEAIRRGELPALRCGRRILVPVPALMALLAGETQAAQPARNS